MLSRAAADGEQNGPTVYDLPSDELWSAVTSLGLARDRRMPRVRRAIRRLPRALRSLDAAWIDALAQFGLVTPYQAAVLRSGQAHLLRVGPWRIECTQGSLGCARVFAAQTLDGTRRVRLIVMRRSHGVAGAVLEPTTSGVLAVDDAGSDGDLRWFATPWIDGITAQRWLVRHGRMPPHLALEVARQVAATLARLEQRGIAYSHLTAEHVFIDGDGTTWVADPRLCIAAADAPNETRLGGCHSAHSADAMIAFGAVVWQLLAGRSPWVRPPTECRAAGISTRLARNIAHIAPNTPPLLAAVVMDCLRQGASARPQSFADLAERLGTSSGEYRRRIAAAAASHKSILGAIATLAKTPRRTRSTLPSIGGAFGPPRFGMRQCVLATVATTMLAVTVCLGLAAWPSAPRHATGDSAHVMPPIGLLQSRAPAEGAATLDHELRTVTYLQAADPPRSAPGFDASTPRTMRPARIDRAALPEMVLPAIGISAMSGDGLVAGQIVRGEHGARPLVLVPAAGLRVAVDDVVFHGIDFMWSARHIPSDAAGNMAMVRAAASRVTFRDCTFQTPARSRSFVAAVDWRHPPSSAGSRVALPHGEIVLERCVLRGVAAAVDAHIAGSLSIEMHHVLHLGPGPLVRLDRPPRPDEPLRFTLEHTTIRGGGEALAIARGEPAAAYGRIAIDAVNSAFALARGAPLVSAAGIDDGRRLFRVLRWSGRGSIVDVDAPLAAWQDASLRWYALADDALSIDGLVRGDMTFRADPDGETADSQLVKWFAPSGSDEAPGIGRGLPELRAEFR